LVTVLTLAFIAYSTVGTSVGSARADVIALKHELEQVKAELKKLPNSMNQAVADGAAIVIATVKTDGIVTRKDIARYGEPIEKEVLPQLVANTQTLADLKKAAVEQYASVKAENLQFTQQLPLQQIPPQPAPQPIATEERHQNSTVTAHFVTNVSAVPREDPARHLAFFENGGASKIFSKWDVENLNIVLAPLQGIHATLIYRNGLFKTWSRVVEIQPGERFDIKEAAQVVFWSDSAFWLTWNKY
jgi:hypothetical protein